MPYQFATHQEDYTDYAGGRVLYSLPDHPAFPVRLVSEIFQRCQAARAAEGLTGPCTLYDPCCGGAYHLTTLAYLHWDAIESIIASDINEDATSLAQRNLGLLTPEGLSQRVAQLTTLRDTYGKPSHAAALESAQRLRARMLTGLKSHTISTRVFCADALAREEIAQGLAETAVDIILTDVPYGQKSSWERYQGVPNSNDTIAPGPNPVEEGNALWQMLNALRPVIAAHTILAIATDKKQKVTHDAYRRIERFNLGKRRIEILKGI